MPKPNYPRIIAEMAGLQWAITPEAMGGLVAAVELRLTADDRELFHAADEDTEGAIAAELGSRLEGSQIARVKGRIGSLLINGPIVPRADAFTRASGLVSIDSLTSEFLALQESNEIDSIVLVFDSPGGAVTGISEFASLVAGCGKHVTAYVYGAAASAAYWIASAADVIVGSPTSITGSIGVILRTSAPKDDGSITIESEQSPNKNTDPSTEKGHAELKKMVTNLASVFVSTVAENRGVSVETVLKDFGQGGVMVAAEALGAGLIDKVDTLANTMLPKSSNSDNITIMAEGPKTKEIENMPTLQELRAQHPAINAEIEALEKAAREDGASAEQAEIKKRTECATKYLGNASYPEVIQAMARAVLDGKQDTSVLVGTVAMFDALSESKVVAAAIVDSGSQPDTPALTAPTARLSQSGILDSTAAIDAEILALRGEL